jgi:hypothetical protein
LIFHESNIKIIFPYKVIFQEKIILTENILGGKKGSIT